MITYRQRVICHCINDLRKAFKCNLEAHKWRDYINANWYIEDVSYEVKQRDKMYYLKTKYLIKAIEKIKRYKLPIKYWTNKWITYFEYWGKQVSYHTFSNMDNVWWKKYKWDWTGIINETFPL